MRTKLSHILGSLFVLGLLIIPQVAFAIPPPAQIKNGNVTVVPEFTNLSNATASGIDTLIPYFIDKALQFITILGIVMLIIAGYMFITSHGKDEQITKAKHTVTYTIIGLALATFCRIIVEIFYKYQRPEPLNVTLAQSTTQTIIDFGEGVLTLVAILFIVIAGYFFVTAHGNEEQTKKAKHSLAYGMGGLALVTLSAVLPKIFFPSTTIPTTIVSGQQVFGNTLANSTVQTIVNFGELLLGAIAVLFIVIAGYLFITANGKEEQLTKAKHSLAYSAVGLVVVVLAETITRTFFNFNAQTNSATGNVQLGISTVITITNLILGFVGVIAVLMLVFAGFQYITARGEEEQTKKAKQTIMYAAIGLIVIIFAYVVVSVVVGGNV